MKYNTAEKSIIEEITDQYKKIRLQGKHREAAVEIIKGMYFDELHDKDDRALILSALSLALCKKKELTNSLAQETLYAISDVRSTTSQTSTASKLFDKVEQYLKDKSFQGAEAVYRKRAPYIPAWENGDLLSHRITFPRAESLGISGWSILFYKVGVYVDTSGNHRQLMFVSLCPPGMEPTNSSQLKDLGFLRMMKHGDKWDYLVQINPKNKKEEQSYELTKIGNFKGIQPPTDCTTEDPLVSMPMHGYLKKTDICPFYEDQICRIFKKFGKYLPNEY